MTVTTTGVETEEDLAELVDKEGELSTVKRGRAMHQKIYYYNDHRCIIIIIIIIITVYSPQLCGHLLQPAHLLRLLQAVHLGAVQQAGLQVSGQCTVLVTHIMVIAAVQKCHMTVHKRCYERGVTPCNAGQRSLVKQQSTFSTCGDEKRFSALAIDIPHDFR